MAKQYVLVSQGIEIYRTENKSEAEKIMKNNNDKWLDYCQKCINDYEYYVDNKVVMYVEENGVVAT